MGTLPEGLGEEVLTEPGQQTPVSLQRCVM